MHTHNILTKMGARSDPGAGHATGTIPEAGGDNLKALAGGTIDRSGIRGDTAANGEKAGGEARQSSDAAIAGLPKEAVTGTVSNRIAPRTEAHIQVAVSAADERRGQGKAFVQHNQRVASWKILSKLIQKRPREQIVYVKACCRASLNFDNRSLVLTSGRHRKFRKVSD